MIKFHIFDRNIDNVPEVRSILRDYANNNNIIIKEKSFVDVNEIIDLPADACLIEFNSYLENEEILKHWQMAYGSKFIFLTNDILNIVDIIQNHPEEYCLLAPIEEMGLGKVLTNLKARIRKRSLVIKMGHHEDQRIYLADLNFIDITNRNLNYHLVDKKELHSQTLRQSFAKEVDPLLVNPELYFIQPSLLINLTNVEILYGDHMQFESGDILYFPKTAYANLSKAWKNYYC